MMLLFTPHVIDVSLTLQSACCVQMCASPPHCCRCVGPLGTVTVLVFSVLTCRRSKLLLLMQNRALFTDADHTQHTYRDKPSRADTYLQNKGLRVKDEIQSLNPPRSHSGAEQVACVYPNRPGEPRRTAAALTYTRIPTGPAHLRCDWLVVHINKRRGENR